MGQQLLAGLAENPLESPSVVFSRSIEVLWIVGIDFVRISSTVIRPQSLRRWL